MVFKETPNNYHIIFDRVYNIQKSSFLKRTSKEGLSSYVAEHFMLSQCARIKVGEIPYH